jgi:heme-degrading monooxygenase HmoA
MTIRIFIKRSVTGSSEHELNNLLHKMRRGCLRQSGYISGQTLKRIDSPGERLVISTWKSLEDWEEWFSSDERSEIQMEIDSLLGDDTVYEVYH